MGNKAVRPEDILPDGTDTTTLNGVQVRKGTIAAFLANVEILENPESTETQKLAAIGVMKELAPSVIVTGLHKHATFKNAQIEQILFDANV